MSDLELMITAIAEAEESDNESFYSIPSQFNQFKPQLELWADEVSVAHARLVNYCVQSASNIDPDLAFCLTESVDVTFKLDELLLLDEEDISLDAFLDCMSLYRKFDENFQALIAPSSA